MHWHIALDVSFEGNVALTVRYVVPTTSPLLPSVLVGPPMPSRLAPPLSATCHTSALTPQARS